MIIIIKLLNKLKIQYKGSNKNTFAMYKTGGPIGNRAKNKKDPIAS